MTLDLPAPINATDVESWGNDVDVVVVGFGIAGPARRSRPPGPAPA